MRHEGKSEGEERRGEEEEEERRGRNHGENLDCGKPSTFFFFSFHLHNLLSPSLPSDQLSQHAGQEKQSAVHSFCAADKFIY